MSEPLIVAIDGPAGVGKSTVAKRLAERLGVPVLDTGAMYRTLGLRVLELGIDPADAAAVSEVVAELPLEVRRVPSKIRLEILLDGEPVGERIRTESVGEATSQVSAHRAVRERMVELQRACAARHGAVVEGRDIGTVVFPDTPHKFFLDARPEIRARRRHLDLLERGERSELLEVGRDLARRDARDRGREAAPLRHDDTYVVIDTSDREVEAVVERMLSVIDERK